MDNKTKIRLAKKNNKSENFRRQETAKEISNYYSLSKEIGIIGDALEYLFDLVSQLHVSVLPDSAFTEWRNRVAEIKEDIKKQNV